MAFLETNYVTYFYKVLLVSCKRLFETWNYGIVLQYPPFYKDISFWINEFIHWKQLIMWSCERNCWRSCWGVMFNSDLLLVFFVLGRIYSHSRSRAYELCSDCSHHLILMAAGGVIWPKGHWRFFPILLGSSIKFFLVSVGFNTQLLAAWSGSINF